MSDNNVNSLFSSHNQNDIDKLTALDELFTKSARYKNSNEYFSIKSCN